MNLKSKLITLKEKVIKLEKDSNELDIKYDKVIFVNLFVFEFTKFFINNFNRL